MQDSSCNKYSIFITTTINIILFLILLIYLHGIMYLITVRTFYIVENLIQ